MDKTAALKIAIRYAQEVTRVMKPDRIILFGSHARGNPSDESDIDIAVVLDGLNGDWFHTCNILSSLTWKVSTFIEPVLLDLQDSQSGFLEEVLRTGDVVYQRPKHPLGN